MIKVDLCGRETHIASVSLCMQREFFPLHMGLCADELPEPLRGMAVAEEIPYAFHRYALPPDLIAAARAILVTPRVVRREGLYAKAKATELMCLLINRLGAVARIGSEPLARKEVRLYEARDMTTRHFAEDLTLERL